MEVILATKKANTYPNISRRNWRLIRDALKRKVPSAITPGFVAAQSEMTDDSARANVIGPLRGLGLIDDNGKPTSLAERWRHDDEYSRVCEEILEKTYPEDLRDAFPTPGEEQRGAIKTWFMKAGQVGEAAAAKAADTFLLLNERNPSVSPEPRAPSPKATPPASKPSPKTKRSTERATAPTTNEPAHVAVSSPSVVDRIAPVPASAIGRFPSIHVDVQIHIAPDASPEQIDKIFESMAKHLSGFSK
jgi:negative regulator of sigma E activity